MICRGLCACAEMLWMCVLYVSFRSKVRPRTFGCIAMGSALLCILRSRLLVYSARSGVQVLSGFRMRLFCLSRQKLYVGMVVYISCLHSCFLYITFTFLLHLLLSWTSSLSISSSAISASTLSNHVFLGLPTGLLPSTLYSIHFFTQSSSPFLITCPYHLSLPLLMKVVIGSISTSLLNSSFVLLSFNEI